MASSSSTKREERAQDRALEKTIDETKSSTNKVIQEAKRELPEYTTAFHDYQEQNIDTIKEMTSVFLDSQKHIARSLRSSSGRQQAPYMPFWNLWGFYGPNQSDTIEAYATFVNNFAENSIAATRLSNEMVISSMEATRGMLQHAKKNSKAISKYMMDSAEAPERT